MTDREQALLMRIQFLIYRLEHSYFTQEQLRARWRAELFQICEELSRLRATQS